MTAFSQSLLQQLDVNGCPLSHWTVAFFVSGTQTPVTVYKDVACTSAHAIPVQADAQGRLPTIYFKANGVTLRADLTFPDGRVKSIDGIDPGSAPSAVNSTSSPLIPVVNKTAVSTTMIASDWRQVIDIATTAGNIAAVLLPKASTLANGTLGVIRNYGSGTVIVRTQGNDLVNDRGSFLLTGMNETAILCANGAGFEIIAQTARVPNRFLVLSNIITLPPIGANAGDTYLAPIAASGIWSPNYIYVADGIGGWIGHAPQIGDEVINQAASVSVGVGTTAITFPGRLFWTGTVWADESAFISASVSASSATTTSGRVLAVRGDAASGTSSASFYSLGSSAPALNSYTQAILGTTLSSTLTGASLAANLITLPTGSYRVTARHKFHGAIAAQLKFVSTSTISNIQSMPKLIPASTTQDVQLDGYISVTAATEVFQLMWILAGTSDAMTLGQAAAIPGVEEVFCEVFIQGL